MRRLRLVLSLPLAAIFLAGADAALAGTFSYDSYSVVNEQTINITNPNAVTGGAGEIVLNGTGANAGTTLPVWCLDIYNFLANSGTYNVGTLTMAGAGGLNPTLTATQIGQIGALMLNGGQLINSSADASAATQLAIWKVEYGSSFAFNGDLSPGAVSIAQTELNNLNGLWAPVSPTLLSGPGNQTMGFVTTPLPATWSMLLAALVGVGMLTARDYRPKSSFAC
jgi:hypothetical protein